MINAGKSIRLQSPTNLLMIRAFFILALTLLPSPLIAKRPNILFAISDDQSWIHTSAYGCTSVKTPAFDRVAESGVLFTQAIAASPGCSPCRAAILTGRNTWEIKHAGTHASYFDPRFPVFPKLLEQAGYVVGATGKLWGPGNWKHLGFKRNPAGPEFNQIKNKPPFSGLRSTDYAANFEAFLEQCEDEAPFFFWYGASEPHRKYEKGSGLKAGKDLKSTVVPPFLPGHDEIKSDVLDYLVEVEWFDSHLGKMLDLLEKRGELNNTLVIVTSDNGMPFPRAKANNYEYGIHLPLAISWPEQVPGGRTVSDLIQFIDYAPTMLEAAEIPIATTASGRSMLSLLRSPASDSLRVEMDRNAAYSARERHSSSRWNNLAYPIRSLRTHEHLLIWNVKPDRWPAGAPQKFHANNQLGPMHGGYHDIDACPSLTYLIEGRNDPEISKFFHLAVDRRPEFELFDVVKDPGNLTNLANLPTHQNVKNRLVSQLKEHLKKTGDPRVLGYGDVWETYKRVSSIRRFPKPTP